MTAKAPARHFRALRPYSYIYPLPQGLSPFLGSA